MEIWKDVLGYEGLYEVSNKGQVRTKEGKKTYSKRHGVRVWKQRIMKQYEFRRTWKIMLYKDRESKNLSVHRLVAKAFIPNPKNLPQVNHIDGNRLNNAVENLEWCDAQYNNNHAFENELNPTGNETILINLETGEKFRFRSKSKASEFLGKNPKYISHYLRMGKDVLCGYKVISEEGKWHEWRAK